jgi:hypothetical protein
MPPAHATAIVTTSPRQRGDRDLCGLDAADRALLDDFAPAFERALPAIIAACNAQIQASADGARRRADGADIDGLVRAQARHWADMFEGQFDTSYADSARGIALLHRQVGLGPHWPAADHGLVATRICTIAAEHAGCGFRPGRIRRVARLSSVVIKALRLDAGYTESVYNEGSAILLAGTRAEPFGQTRHERLRDGDYCTGRLRGRRTPAAGGGALPASPRAAGLYVI